MVQNEVWKVKKAKPIGIGHTKTEEVKERKSKLHYISNSGRSLVSNLISIVASFE